MKIYAANTDKVEQRELDNAKIARALAGECMVLLENDGTLPISANGGKIALYGNGARATIKGGTGSGDVNSRSVVNVEQGFKNAGFYVTTENWIDRQQKRLADARADYLQWIEDEAKRLDKPVFAVNFDHPFKEPACELITDADVADSDTDTAVYVISRNSGEGADRFNEPGDYQLFDEEIENIKLAATKYDKLIVVLNIGGIIDIKQINDIEGVNAILLMVQLGNIGGDALLDVLTGEVTPSGKTTDTWAVSYGDYPSSAKFSHHESVHDEMYEDGIFVGYRYFDSFGVKPQYPFGYGKSYTDFSIEVTSVNIVDETSIQTDVKVTNIGSKYSGKEVVQIYYSAPQGKLVKPVKELAAYKKTSLLAPGESQTLTISFDARDMASYCEKDASWKLESGDYAVLVGDSAANLKKVAIISITNEIKTEINKKVFALDCDLKEIQPKNCDLSNGKNESEKQGSDEQKCLACGCDESAISGVIITGAAITVDSVALLSIDASAIKAKTFSYTDVRKEFHTDKTEKITMSDVLSGKATVEELVAQLTIEKLADFCVGTQRTDGSVLGNASNMVPGAAGDTSSICTKDRGIENVIMADGPAGLRLQPHFKTTKDGKLLPGGEVLGDAFTPFDPSLDEIETDDYFQYATAIPIGWALAQSWNTELLEEAGDMVGSEMERFGVDLWLAPALNIHRNPLCGRNFEYYSEDPLVAGKTAAAITRGVQKHKGRGTTIKHFAANNQEDNRYFVNAHVSERAMREIYLKGFEIAVKESNPLSIMTSYNLLNGIHTANSFDLLQTVCRDEWGYEGLIMTDWCTSQDIPSLTGKYDPIYPISASTGCIYSGNDLQMPGCQANVDDIVKAVSTGEELDGFKITKADLQHAAANVLKCVVNCKG